MSSIPVIESIRSALAATTNADSGGVVANVIRRRLGTDGYTLVQKAKKERLQELLGSIYVDKRKTHLVEALEEARRLVKSL